MRALFLFVLLCTLAMPSRADVLIDDFSSGPLVRELPVISVSNFDDSTQAGTMLGGTRETFVSFGLVAASADPLHLTIDAGLTLSASAGTAFSLAVQYLPTQIDLSTEDRFRVDFTKSTGPLSVVVEVFSPTGSSGFSIDLGPSAVPFSAEIALAALLPLGSPFPDNPVDLTHVNRIAFQFDGPLDGGAQSLQVASIRAVPEPATWLETVAGVLFAAAIVARRRTVA